MPKSARYYPVRAIVVAGGDVVVGVLSWHTNIFWKSDFFLTLVAMLPFLGEVMKYYADHQVELEFITKYLGVIVVVFGLAVVGVVGLRATVWVVRIVATVMPP
jgi:hypothetical protein